MPRCRHSPQTLGLRQLHCVARPSCPPSASRTSPLLRLCLGSALVSATGIYKVVVTARTQCEYRPKRTRLAGQVRASAKAPHEPPFPWKEFFKLLWPDLWYLIGAVVVGRFIFICYGVKFSFGHFRFIFLPLLPFCSFLPFCFLPSFHLSILLSIELKYDWYLWFLKCLSVVQSALAVAIISIQIPILLGDVVNVVSKYSAATSENNFMQDMRKPSLRIIQMYGIQVPVKHR